MISRITLSLRYSGVISFPVVTVNQLIIDAKRDRRGAIRSVEEKPTCNVNKHFPDGGESFTFSMKSDVFHALRIFFSFVFTCHAVSLFTECTQRLFTAQNASRCAHTLRRNI